MKRNGRVGDFGLCVLEVNECFLWLQDFFLLSQINVNYP